jgi:hypothetical protein
MFLGMVTDRDDVVPFNPFIFIHMVRGVLGNVHTILFHDGHGTRIQSMGFDSGTINVCEIVLKVVQIAMRHLATARISGTKYQYIFHKGFFSSV